MPFDSLLYDFLLLLHILLFVYWLGADLAVLYSARYAADPSLSIETRLTISRIMAFVDLFPRLSVPLTGAVGLQLAVMGGYLDIPAVGLALAWLVALSWAANSLYIYRRRATPADTAASRTVDVALRGVVLVVAGGYASYVLAGGGAAGNRLVAAKLVIYALAILLSLVLRNAFRPFRPALMRAASGTATDADTTIMQSTLARTRPIVLGLWGTTVVAAALGVRL